MSFDVAFVGTGPEPENQVWGESAAMAYRHAWGYDQLEDCDLVACADVVRENAEDFADEFGIDHDHIFEDYAEMCHEVEPDIVSIATPVPTHADLVVGTAETGVVDAIHCEKPMADTWGDSKRMAAACDEEGVQLTFNHQRRFSPMWREAKTLLDDGEIGELRRLETAVSNLFDWGTHAIDLMNLYNDEHEAEWVLAGLDYRDENVRYGTHNENQAIALWAYENGVHGLASMANDPEYQLFDAYHRIVGTDGEIEVGGEAPLRIRRAGDEDWEEIEVEEVNAIAAAIEHLVSCLDSGEQPEIDAEHALRTMEIIFAGYESVRRRGRVEFPLDVDDNALEDLVDRGELNPE